MPAIASDRVTVLYDRGFSPRWTVYLVRNFGTADTLDISNRYAGTVEVATFLTGASTTVGTVTSTTAANLTLTLAGSTAVTGVLTVRGQSSTGVIVSDP